MWLAQVKAKAKRKNQILFSKDSLLLADLCQLIAQANRRALILWALELAEETARELAENYPKDHRPQDAIAASRAWAASEIKMPIAKQVILSCHGSGAWIGRLQRTHRRARNVLRTAASLLDGI